MLYRSLYCRFSLIFQARSPKTLRRSSFHSIFGLIAHTLSLSCLRSQLIFGPLTQLLKDSSTRTINTIEGITEFSSQSGQPSQVLLQQRATSRMDICLHGTLVLKETLQPWDHLLLCPYQVDFCQHRYAQVLLLLKYLSTASALQV